MKMMMVAVFSEGSTNNSQAGGFEQCGAEVIRYNYRERAARLGKQGRDEEIIRICQTGRPDLVFFSKCNEVDIRVVQACKEVSTTVLWYMDPLNANFNAELIAKIRECHFTCCALHLPYTEALRYSPNVHFVHEGFDAAIDKPVDVPYRHDVSFIGTLRGERADYHREIGFHHYHNAFGTDHARAVAESRINLNFTEGGTSDRTYKVLASKGFLLTQPWPEMALDFEDGKDLVTFRGMDDLKEKIAYYLTHEKERLAIAENGYEAVQQFSRKNFAAKLLLIANEHRSN